MRTHNWGGLTSERYLAVVADRSGKKIDIEGFDDEDVARSYCENFDSIHYEWVVISGFVVSSGERTDGRRQDSEGDLECICCGFPNCGHNHERQISRRF